ncbi:MAG TPA: hypothetical protein VN922_03130 [Bacteroidia bacterium]|nr:hypothetical protein [Bacteroidia bacterium]
MKKILLALFITITALQAGAQDYYAPPTNRNNSVQSNNTSTNSSSADSVPRFYLGLGTGLNNYVGIIGIGAELRTIDPLLVRAGIGIGTWGTKITIGLRYELHHTSGWVFGVSYSNCSGLSNFKTNLQVDSAGNSTNKNVTLNLNDVGVLNLTATYNWVFHRRNKFFLEFGWSVPLQTNPYSVQDGSVLTPASEQVIGLLEPGGLIIGIGVMFGL